MSLLAMLVRSQVEQEGVSTAALVPILDTINHDSSSSVSQFCPVARTHAMTL